MPTGKMKVTAKRKLSDIANIQETDIPSRKSARTSESAAADRDDGAEYMSSSEDEPDVEVITASIPLSKPKIELPTSKALHERMNALLPQLQQTEEELEQLRQQPLDDVEDGEEHIALELGLGVLEEQNSEDESSDSSDSDTSRSDGETDRLHKLMHVKGSQKETKVGIEEVG